MLTTDGLKQINLTKLCLIVHSVDIYVMKLSHIFSNIILNQYCITVVCSRGVGDGWAGWEIANNVAMAVDI